MYIYKCMYGYINICMYMHVCMYVHLVFLTNRLVLSCRFIGTLFDQSLIRERVHFFILGNNRPTPTISPKVQWSLSPKKRERRGGRHPGPQIRVKYLALSTTCRLVRSVFLPPSSPSGWTNWIPFIELN